MVDQWLTLVTAPLFLWSWMALAVATAVLLTRLSAPYGRHARGGWGPSFPASWSWMAMEAVSLAGFGLCFALSERRDAVSWAWLGLYALHYGYRSFVYPFRMARNHQSVLYAVIEKGGGCAGAHEVQG